MAREQKNPGADQLTPQSEETEIRIWENQSSQNSQETIRGRTSCKERNLWGHAEGLPQEVS